MKKTIEYWVKDKNNYFRVHAWMYKNYGKAIKCDNPTCKRTCNKFEWSNKSHDYKKDINDWQQLCITCHRSFDNNNFVKCKKGHDLVGENVYIHPKDGKRECKICRKNAAIRFHNKQKVTF